MGDIFSYLDSHKDISFTDSPLNPADYLALTQLSYLNFEKIEIFRKGFHFLSPAKEHLEEISMDTLSPKRNKRLFQAVCESMRFADLQMGEVEAVLTDDVQYCSITYRLKNHYIIVFRGTDLAISGWKEDLKLGIEETIPSHQIGLKYTERIILEYPGTYTLCGHSKGGNVALFVGIHLSEARQELLREIYNFDGPGFNSNVLETSSFSNIASIHHKFVPEDDIVGLLLNHVDQFKIIKSKFMGIFQHDLYLWQIENENFVYVDHISHLSKILSRSIYQWLMALSYEEKEELVYYLEDVFQRANITNLNQFKKNTFKTIKSYIFSYLNLPFQQKKQFFKLSMKLLKYYIKASFGALNPEK